MINRLHEDLPCGSADAAKYPLLPKQHQVSSPVVLPLEELTFINFNNILRATDLLELVPRSLLRYISKEFVPKQKTAVSTAFKIFEFISKLTKSPPSLAKCGPKPMLGLPTLPPTSAASDEQ